MGLLPLFLLSYFRPVTEQEIIVWLRVIPALFAVATIAMVFVLSRRYFGHRAAWMAATLMAFVPRNFLEMSSISHADVPQIFFLVLSLYFCCRLAEERRRWWLFWASVAAGLAFSCKYTGLFLLPLAWLLWSMQTLREGAEPVGVKAARVARLVRLLAAVAGFLAIGAGVVIIPRLARPYGDARYFGVVLSQLFLRLRLLAGAAGVGLLGLVAFRPFWRMVGQRPRLASVLEQTLLSLAAFGAAFAAMSPFNVFDVRSGFLRGFLYESLHSSFGHTIAENSSPLLWLSVLLSPELLDGLVLGLAAISLALVLAAAVKRGSWSLLGPAAVLWLWAIAYFAFLLWRVNLRTYRALLPIVPCLIMLAAQGWAWLAGWMAGRLPRRIAPLVAIAGALLVVGLELPASLDRIGQFRQSTSRREETSVAVVAGHWLAEHYSPSRRVLYDPYSYVPPVFADATATPYGGTLQLLQAVDPDIVVTSSAIADRFSDVGQASAYARDESEFLANHGYYEALRRGEAGYVLTRDFGEVQVYERRRGGRRNQKWESL